ncbi:MAG TPA: phosphoribosylglycinamide formyltransferase [Thermomicrobiales bacterium]|nr:phosphoribosylglycinamide formyltransferase [Thermomicrobiales bacterium]
MTRLSTKARSLNRTAPLRLAVLISGSGRTLANLIAAHSRSEIPEIGLVVSSKPDVRGLAIAAEAGIPSATVQRSTFASDTDFSRAIYDLAMERNIDLLICAGFLKRLVVPPVWTDRILNIHPALIPESAAAGEGFYGDRVHAAVLAAGLTESGATVHVVDNEYDHGPVVLKQIVPVLPGDTAQDLAARVFAAECLLYPRAIATHIANRPDLFNR